MELREKKLNSNPSALLPILIFLVLYLGMGLIFEYGIGINMAFYDIPIVVTFMVALLVACLQNKKLSFDEKLVLMGRGVGDKNIITMILIFLVAGVFVGVTGGTAPRPWPIFCCPSPLPGPLWRFCSSPPALCPPLWAPLPAPSP